MSTFVSNLSFTIFFLRMETRSDASLRKELDELRKLFKQASEEARQAKEQAQQAQDLAQRQSELDKAKIDDLELAIRVASLPSISSPVPNTNLLPTITAAAPIDEHRLNNAINEISREFDANSMICAISSKTMQMHGKTA